VRPFCNEEEHNAEAPNEQNSKCKKATRTVIFQESVDKDALHNLKPLPSPPPAPTFRVLQRGPQVVCLVLYVSTSMMILQEDDNKTIGDEIIFLTDGEATDNVQECLQEAVQSGTIIHTISFGPNADSVLKTMADQTGGKFYVVPKYSHKLVGVFSSVTLFDGNPMTQPIQLESTVKEVAGWLNGTVPIDRAVGNQTTFIIIYKTSAPTVYLQSPSGLRYDQRITSDIANTITLTVPGTAESNPVKIRWSEDFKTLQYIFSSANLVNTFGRVPQAFGLPEKHTFQPSVTLQHGTTLFFAIQSVDKQAAKSEVSNIARVTKNVPTHRPPTSSNLGLNLPPQTRSSNPGLNLPPQTCSSYPGLNLTAIIFSVGVMTIVVCLIAVVITWH
ncbi:hypothetical protein QTP70_023280, partial [Hemibagrus guttatus]